MTLRTVLIIFAVVLFATPTNAQMRASQMGCGEFRKDIPLEILSVIQKEENDRSNIRNITEKSFSGYFFGIYYDGLHLEGMFYENESGELIICDITFTVKIDRSGKAEICLDKRGGE